MPINVGWETSRICSKRRGKYSKKLDEIGILRSHFCDCYNSGAAMEFAINRPISGLMTPTNL
jgi:hypothetical protein